MTADSRLLMRRNIVERVTAIAPFLTFDPDPYIVLGADGRLTWMMDGFTTSDSYPYARHYRLNRERVNYLRNSVKAAVDAYDGTVTFYVFDTADPIIAAYRQIFPTLFKDDTEMPPDLRAHVRYPELMLQMQAAVYGLYHMGDPAVFYNREDLWSVASEVGMNARREQSTQVMEPNFVLMKLPGEAAIEFVEMLPFTPANRNNLIGWIAGRSDEPHYGSALVYNFPENRLVDGPLQVEARIDQNPQLSAQLSLWNQQGSRVRRGGLIVIPIGRALLYAEPIYLQAERSPMPELRLVVLALQDRLGYGPTFEAALVGAVRRRGSVPTRRTVSAPAGGSGRRVDRIDTSGAVDNDTGADRPAHLGSRARPRGVPAPDRRGQARRGRPAARVIEASARAAVEPTSLNDHHRRERTCRRQRLGPEARSAREHHGRQPDAHRLAGQLNVFDEGRERHTPQLDEWLRLLRAEGGSDLYLVAGLPPSIRVAGAIRPARGAGARRRRGRTPRHAGLARPRRAIVSAARFGGWLVPPRRRGPIPREPAPRTGPRRGQHPRLAAAAAPPRRARAAARCRGAHEDSVRPDSRRRPDRLGQDDDGRGTGRPDQSARRQTHHHDRGSD